MLIKLLTEACKRRENSSAKRDSCFPAGGRVLTASKKYILRTDRPTTDDLTFGKISNGHISARGRPIYFMFGSSVGFSGSEDRMTLIPV